MKRTIIALSVAAYLPFALVGGFAAPPAAPPATVLSPTTATAEQLTEIRSYIKEAWKTLSRSPSSLVKAAADPKVQPAGARALVYVPSAEEVPSVTEELKKAMSPAEWSHVELRALPKGDASALPPGLIYLPHPYVVPGGRFNEMYGWDSYFIFVGLLRDGELELAKGMTENFLFEVRHYGKILNANRTYYLTRSQPPFLSEMVMGVYGQTKDKKWLHAAMPLMERYYGYWTTAPHIVKKTGLSRYWDSGDGPAPEVVSSERDAQGKTHYDRVKEYLKANPIPGYPLARYYDAKKDELTPFFYKNDRSMRESGFDPSDRFGPFNSEVVNIDPVCLNSLLYRMELDIAEAARALGDEARAKTWTARAAARKGKINALNWDEKDGLYYDYDHEKGAVRRYPFVTTFYPLWAGIASATQAERVRSNLKLFERPGGLMTSTKETGKQWDAPFSWAPMQIVADEGLRRYGYAADADRVSANFLSMILKEFIEHHAIKEKYDVAARSSDLEKGLRFGYASNEIGFGWTNAAFTELYARLSESSRALVLKLDGVPIPERK
ncbi:MAG: alpha,alpha-trehalase [Elusimicrobia bacterium]|nr:alpha,alpha-trehalase [Elusimicrobiota bacterium]